MAHWLYPANVKIYDVMGAFSIPETLWPMNSKVSVGDRIYIYLAAPHSQIFAISDVAETDIDQADCIDEIRHLIKGPIDQNKSSKPFMKLTKKSEIPLDASSRLGYSCLKENGLNGMLMGPRKLENCPNLFTYIKGLTP